jgi:SAM-dependent methyltransferase
VPWRAAASVAVGLAIGVTPLWGLHFWLVLAVCVPLRLDSRIAYLAANISLPFIAPFLTAAEIEIGLFARSGHWMAVDARAIEAHGAAAFALDLVIGTLLFSPAVATLGFVATYALARRWRKAYPPADPLEAALLRAGDRYRGSERFYVRAKIASDPVVRDVLALGALGEIVDVGCGRGQMVVVLLEAGHATRGSGFDWDGKKIEAARAAAEGLPASFALGDSRNPAIADCDTVLLIDVLHYLTDEEQDVLLARATRAARARVVVRELDPNRGWRSGVTRVQEAITTAFRWNRGARVRVRPISEIERALKERGFAVSVVPCWGATPFSNVLVMGTRIPT